MVARVVRSVLLDVGLVLPHSLLEGIGRETCVGLRSVVRLICHRRTVDNVAVGAGVGGGTSLFQSSPEVAGWHYCILCTTQDSLVVSGNFSTHILQGLVRDLGGVCVHNWG